VSDPRPDHDHLRSRADDVDIRNIREPGLMESLPVPSSLVGAVVFFGLLGMLAWLLIRETLRIVLKPALVVGGLVLVAVWTGVLDQTLVGRWLSWTGDRVVAGAAAAGQWATGAWEGAREDTTGRGS
jgi:hypothetical protein